MKKGIHGWRKTEKRERERKRGREERERREMLYSMQPSWTFIMPDCLLRKSLSGTTVRNLLKFQLIQHFPNLNVVHIFPHLFPTNSGDVSLIQSDQVCTFFQGQIFEKVTLYSLETDDLEESYSYLQRQYDKVIESELYMRLRKDQVIKK